MSARGRRMRWGAGMLLAVTLAGISLALLRRYTYACILNRYDSVHFKNGTPDFGLPPRRAILTWRGEHDDRPQTEEDSGATPDGQELDEPVTRLRDVEIERKHGLMTKAVDAAIRNGHWSEARGLLERFCNRHRWTGEERDMQEILRQLEARATAPSAGFLAALGAYRDGLAADHKAAQIAFDRIQKDPAADFLREHALYQQASLAAELFDYPRAVDLYEQLLAQYPHTAKREDTLVMIARCGLLPQTAEGRRVEQGRAALALLRREFPHTRFQRDLVGLQARLDMVEGRWSQAVTRYIANNDLASVERVLRAMPAGERGPIRARLLAAYVRTLTATHSYERFAHALQGADRTRQAMTGAQFAQFRQLILRDPDSACGYLYYRLYHTEVTAKDRRSLVQFADRLVALHPAARLSVPVQVRLAEVYYRDRLYPRALAWADRALKPKWSDRALYVRAATLNKLGRSEAARADFERLMSWFPDSPLIHGTRENLALLYERRGEYGRALDEYLALNYRSDIAYILDIRMSSEQVATYLRQLSPEDGRERVAIFSDGWEYHGPNEQEVALRHLLAYTLAIRYMREERWQQARALLHSLPAATYRTLTRPSSKDYDEELKSDPLRALADLERLHRAIRLARSDNARASALYRYASYYSTHDLLLLYNAPLWNGEREMDFQFYWNTHTATSGDLAAVRAHMYAHEVYAHSRQICLDLARRYPDSPTVPYALYRAACAARHLASFNTWWDEEDNRHDYWRESTRLMTRVARNYPHHPLAVHARKYARVFAEERQDHWRWEHSSRRSPVTSQFALRDE